MGNFITPFEINDNGYPLNDNKEALPGYFQPIPRHNTGIEDMILKPDYHKVCALVTGSTKKLFFLRICFRN